MRITLEALVTLVFIALCGVRAQECSAAEGESCPSTATVKVAKGANSEGAPPQVQVGQCQDRHPNECASYAQAGECEKNPGWMIVNCPSSCHACHLLNPKLRCDRNFLNISTEPIYAPGDMENMFRSIVPEFGHVYDIEVLSESPWVVVLNNFVQDDEIEAIIDSVSDNWERSTDTGSMNEFGETGRVLSKSRTSSNAWCRHRCEENPLVMNIVRKIEAVTRIPYSHYESFQILRYEPGQYYRAHHDMAPRQAQLACGPRILTFFIYLSDVEEGGETAFPQLGISVKPKKGSALLWPSTLSNDVMTQDSRTIHEARPVIKGVKFAANSWIHSHDFQKTNLWGCTGSFDYL